MLHGTAQEGSKRCKVSPLEGQQPSAEGGAAGPACRARLRGCCWLRLNHGGWGAGEAWITHAVHCPAVNHMLH